jgi:hypothetical protein
MNRRQFFAGLVLTASSFGAMADDKKVIVVKIINFSCPVCRASENQDAPVISAAIGTGGQFAYAPIPSVAGEYAPEKVYYAVRKQGREAEKHVRLSLYRGAQDMNQPFTNIPQVIEWLKDDVPNEDIDWVKLANDAQSKDAGISLAKAASITQRAGAQALPAYVLIQENAPVATLDINTSGKGSSLLNLREEVIKRIGQLASDKKQ